MTADNAALLENLLALLRAERTEYCVIGGVAVNAYCEPVVTLDLDLVLAAEELSRLEPLLRKRFEVTEGVDCLNVHAAGSDLRVQIQTDPRYARFPDHAQLHTVLGHELPVARPRDLMQAKIWAALDPHRRASKRQRTSPTSPACGKRSGTRCHDPGDAAGASVLNIAGGPAYKLRNPVAFPWPR